MFDGIEWVDRLYYRIILPSFLLLYLLIDLDGGNVPLSATANHSAVFPLMLVADWLPTKVGHFRRRGRLVGIM